MQHQGELSKQTPQAVPARIRVVKLISARKRAENLRMFSHAKPRTSSLGAVLINVPVPPAALPNTPQ